LDCPEGIGQLFIFQDFGRQYYPAMGMRVVISRPLYFRYDFIELKLVC
jgi:hypothetical protein